MKIENVFIDKKGVATYLVATVNEKERWVRSEGLPNKMLTKVMAKYLSLDFGITREKCEAAIKSASNNPTL